MKAVYGWRKIMPLYGVDIINVFDNQRNNNLVRLSNIKGANIEELSRKIGLFIKNASIQSPVISYIDTDPINNINEVEFLIEDLDGYNSLDMLHTTYIETFGKDPRIFDRLLQYHPEYIGIKFVVPDSLSSDHSNVQNAIECLVRSIEVPGLSDSERFLIVIIREDSEIEVLKSYFETIRDALGSDNRVEYAQGGALSAFDIIIRPECKDIKKIVEAHSTLSQPDLELSQQIIVDTNLI